MARVQLQSAFILHGRPYRNSSLLLEALTREHGRIGLVARGVRGRNAARRAVLQSFRELHINYSGRGELRTLGAVEEVVPAPMLSGEALACGYYLNELILKLTARDDPHPDVFDLYRAVLAELPQPPNRDRALRLFELGLLSCLGYGLVLEHDYEGAPLDPNSYYDYSADTGPVPVAGDRIAPQGQRLSGECLLALQKGEIPSQCRREARQLLRHVLDIHLGGQPLKSREYLAELRRLKSGSGEAIP